MLSTQRFSKYLVQFSWFIGEYSRTVRSLCVMVVNEDQCISRWDQAPWLSPVDEPFQLIVAAERVTDLFAVSELGHSCKASVLRVRNSFVATIIDHFLVYEWPSILSETVARVQVLQSWVDNLQIGWPHVLRGVHTEKW